MNLVETEYFKKVSESVPFFAIVDQKTGKQSPYRALIYVKGA
jgi:hypothetical protein